MRLLVSELPNKRSSVRTKLCADAIPTNLNLSSEQELERFVTCNTHPLTQEWSSG